MTVTIIHKRLDGGGVLFGRRADGVVIVADPSTPDWMMSIAQRLAELYDADQTALGPHEN